MSKKERQGHIKAIIELMKYLDDKQIKRVYKLVQYLWKNKKGTI